PRSFWTQSCLLSLLAALPISARRDDPCPTAGGRLRVGGVMQLDGALADLLALVHTHGTVHPDISRRVPVSPAATLPAYDATWPLDRKSTRLNSSHVKISYAVF